MKIAQEHQRRDGRKRLELRPISISSGVCPFAEGSAEALLGATRVIAAASISDASPSVSRLEVSLHLLPRAMRVKLEDEILKRVVAEELRALEQLISRALCRAISGITISSFTIRVDCSVVSSDAGIATAAAAASWTAVYQALRWAAFNKMIPEDVFLPRIAALSVGMVGGHVLVDLTAEESAAAEFSGNLVFDHELKLVEIRAAGESLSLDIAEFMGLIEAGRSGVALIYHDKNYQR